MSFDQSHSLINDFPTASDVVVRVTFKDGEVFRLASCRAVDKTVYDKNGLWCGVIVEVVKVLAKKSKVFHSGGGLDFLEEDIVEIYSEASQQVLFSSKP